MPLAPRGEPVRTGPDHLDGAGRFFATTQINRRDFGIGITTPKQRDPFSCSGAHAGRKVLTLAHAMIAGGSHIDHAEMLRAGSTAAVLGHRVMARSTLETFLRAFTFGHVRQLEAVNGHALERAWSADAGPDNSPFTIDLDSTICEVAGKAKEGAAFCYARVLGYRSWCRRGGKTLRRFAGASFPRDA